MTLQQIESRYRNKAEELINKYFGNLVKEDAIERPETIGDYSLELPWQIEAEYYDYQKGLWTEIAPNGSPSFEEIIDKKYLSDRMTDDDREIIKPAYDDAVTRTLWEHITKTIHKDVTYYKGLLKQYTEDLLTALRCDFWSALPVREKEYDRLMAKNMIKLVGKLGDKKAIIIFHR